MTIRDQRHTALMCAEPLCHEVPALGSAYCERHRPDPTPSRSRLSQVLWVAVIAACGIGIYLMLNARTLLGG